ncbi:MAG: ornithine aminomutase subunit alpha [Spirochaetales bacterium]|nr:ornithine aminomutase subunit alpha [Spirochaetales bacterium]
MNDGITSVKVPEREADFEVRRKHLEALNDEELKKRFWELADKVVSPLIEEAKAYTSPSIERSVLLRMGFSGPEAKAIVTKALEKGLLGHGAGALVLKASNRSGLSVKKAGLEMIKGKFWENET